MTIIDISRRIEADMVVWPGDTRFQLQPTMSISAGASVNLTSLIASAHTGSHIDAPYHFTNDGATVADLDLSPYWGPAQVVTVSKTNGPLLPADFTHVDLKQAPRLLVRSPASAADPTDFPDEFVYPSPALADLLQQQGVVLYGSDTPSVDAADDRLLPGHHALWRNNVVILEWLDLSQAADGLYELAALPLKIVGGDGSPVRAVLRRMAE